MKVLVIGSGGREHTLCWKLNQSPLVDKLYAVPGNAGMAKLADCVELDINNNEALAKFAKDNEIDLTVVGPEAPLVNGLVDVFSSYNLKVFGPTKAAAELEGSKNFAKQIMEKYNVPTGEARVFTNFDHAKAYVESLEPPLVVKADGLAAGKGVIVAPDLETANQALVDCFVDKKFGQAGDIVIVEEYLEGEEVSLLAFVDGRVVLPIVPAQDYKRAYDNDEGLNTGGMGSYSPVPAVSDETYDQIVEKVLKPTVAGLAAEGIRYQGVLYGGLILTKDGPKVLEFNVRFGDPETQAILPRLKSDLAEVMLATVEERLESIELNFSDEVCLTVVAASGGYPANYQTGFVVNGLDEAVSDEKVMVFHAGTALRDGQVVTAGGRVLNVSALGDDFNQVRQRAYRALEKIHFEGMHYRKDIGLKAANSSMSGAGCQMSDVQYPKPKFISSE